MTKLDDLGEVISTDVLVVGGGVAGLATAIKAKEEEPQVDVLIVEKQTTGWAGKATKIGGILAFLGPDNDPDKFLDFQVRTAGFYLNDQELLTKYIQHSYKAIEDFAEWGAKLTRNPDGSIAISRAFWAPEWSTTYIDIDLMLPMRARAKKLGTKIVDKVHVVDLLKQGNRVIGAVGFDLITGKFLIFKAKSTVLANGSCGYKVRRFWMAGTGDGVAAAYRAGAEMRNAEYGNLYGHTVFQETDSGMVGSVFLVNALGENLPEKYLPNSGPSGVFLPVPLAIGMEKEIAEGRGPIYFQPPASSPPRNMHTDLPKLTKWLQITQAKEGKYGLSPDQKHAIAVPLHGETSCIKVDHEMKTSLEGLWAIGDASYAGSAVAGAVASPPGITPGSGIMYAVISAAWAAPAAARYAAGNSSSDVSETEVKAFKDKTFAPMQNSGVFSPKEAVSVLQSLTAPMKYNLRRSKDRIEEALSKLEGLKGQLQDLQAKDPHYLSKCHEINSMVLCAELTYKAALRREESRGFHYREDFPERDDRNWLKWIIIKQDNGTMQLSTQAVPIDTYKVVPE